MTTPYYGFLLLRGSKAWKHTIETKGYNNSRVQTFLARVSAFQRLHEIARSEQNNVSKAYTYIYIRNWAKERKRKISN
jgi:hypothetical protein